MQEVMIKGIKQLYVAKHEDVPMTFEHNNITWSIEWISDFMQEYICTSNDVRAVVVPHRFRSGDTFFVHYVYWYLQDIDLEDLDEGIAQNQIENITAYFENTVVLHYQITRCNDGCKRRFHTLIMPGATYWTARPGNLNWDAVREQRVNILDCPHCGKSFRQPVIKIMGEYIDG